MMQLLPNIITMSLDGVNKLVTYWFLFLIIIYN